MSLYDGRDVRPNELPLPPLPANDKKVRQGKGGSISLGAAGTGRSLVSTGLSQERFKRSKKRY